jgi:plasmid stabilization system protein ParE
LSDYVLSKDAFTDLCEIRGYLRERYGSVFALAAVRELRAAMRRIARDPMAGHLRQDLTESPFRFWTITPYIIIYTGARRPISIVRVLHSSRNIAAIMKQR